MRTLKRLLLAGGAAAALLAGCGGGDVSPNAGEVRLVNATGEFGQLTLYESSDRLSDPVDPFSAGSYEDLDKGAYDFSVRGGVAGATIATLSATLKKGDPMTLVAYSNAGTPALAAIDETEDEPDRDFAKLRFFNTAANDSGAIDAYLIAPTASCADLGGGLAIATAVSDLQSTFIDIEPALGPWRLCITAAGDRTDVRLSTDLAVGDREIVTVILSRTAGAVLLNAAVMVQEGDVTQAANTSARVRLAVGVDSGTVTASFDTASESTSLGSMVAAPSVGAYRLVPTGGILVVTWTGGTVTLPANSISGGGDYTVLVANAGGGSVATASLLSDDNARSTNATKPVKARLVHGATNVSPISLSIGADFIGGVSPGAASSYILTEASGATATKVEITVGGSILCTGLATLSATPTVYSVFALGALPTTPIGPCVIRADR